MRAVLKFLLIIAVVLFGVQVWHHVRPDHRAWCRRATGAAADTAVKATARGLDHVIERIRSG